MTTTITLVIKGKPLHKREVAGPSQGAVKSALKGIPSARVLPRAVLFSRSVLDERPSSFPG